MPNAPTKPPRAAERPRARPADKPRRRRTAEEARDAILDAAERRLIEAGPSGIRLTDVAVDVGLSHPTVLHHFGSREALVDAVIERASAAIHADVLAAMTEAPPGEGDPASVVEHVFEVLDRRGHGRVFTWLALAGFAPGPGDRRLGEVVDASHALRGALRGTDTPPREDTLYTIILAWIVLAAEPTFWPMVAASAGLRDEPRAEARFRTWFAGLLAAHLERGGGAAGVGRPRRRDGAVSATAGAARRSAR